MKIVQKRWLASQQIEKLIFGSELGRTYHLNRKVLNKYASHVKKGIKLHEANGRPLLIDQDTMRVVIERLTNLGTYSDESIRIVLREEYRRYQLEQDLLNPYHNNTKPKLMSYRTLRRYVEKVRSALVFHVDGIIYMD